MANNYTVVSSSTLEFGGESVAAATVPNQSTLVVVPNANYVVGASDFSIGSTLPIEVTSVAFTDTIAAYDASNQVLVTVTLAQWYVMPAADDTIQIDIDGTAHYKVRPRLSFTAVNNVIGSQSAAFAVSTSNSVSISEATEGATKTNTLRCDIPFDSKVFVGTMEFATTGYGFYNSPPQYKIVSTDLSRWSVEVALASYGNYLAYSKDPGGTNVSSNSVDGKLTVYKLDFYYEMGDSDVALSEGESIIFTQPTEVLWSTLAPVVSIDKIRYDGYKNQGLLPSRYIDLSLNVLGSPGATYDILVMDDNGLSYDFALDTFTRALTKSSEQTINLGSPTITTRSNNHIITVPAYNEKAALAKYLTTTVTPTGSTKTAPDGTSTDPHIITLNQFGEIDTLITVSPATDGVAATTPHLLSSLVNKKPLSHPTIFNPTDFPLLSTTNNSYFNVSTPLSYSVTDTVDDSGGFSGTTMTMDTSYVTKKVVVGDTVTGTNIATDTTIAAVNVGGDPLVYTLSKSPSGTVADGATITFTRNVGISRQPLATDFNCSITSADYVGYTIQDQVTQATTSSSVVSITSGEGVVNGQTVQGESIVGYPTVVSGGGSQNLVLSSFQTLPSGELLEFSNAMSDYEIVDINVTGAGTTDCKLNVEGYVNRISYANITESLILQNFITSYVAPVATAQAVDCPLGGSIKVFPLATSHTGVLTIAAFTGSGGGRGSATATLSDDGSYLLYLAPTTGTTETITYTVSDGINTSAAANIVVTLT